MTSGRAENTGGAESSADVPGRSVALVSASSVKRVWSRCLRLLIGVVLILQFLDFVHISLKYPFYFLWDMDEFAATESIGLNSGMIPRAIFHPGFGMHLMNHLVHVPAYRLGIVSAYDLHDVETSLNPLLVMAELTAFLRQLPPILCLAIIVFLWLSVVIHFRLSPGWSLVALLALSTPQSLPYQSAMIRFEIYAIFYWSAAVLLIVVAARSRRPVALWGLVVIAGLMLGLSFLSKVQAVLYLLAFPFAALFLFYTGSAWLERFPRFSKRAALLVSVVTGLGIVVFAGFLLLAARTALSAEIIEFDKDLHQGHKQSVPVFGYGILAAAGLLASFQALCYKRTEQFRRAYAMSAVGSCLFLGFVFSLFTHFLIFPDPSLSLRYLIYDTKMTFVFPGLMEGKGFDYYFTCLLDNITYDWPLYTVLAISVFVLLAAKALNWIPVKRIVLVLLGLACAATVLNLAFCVRFILRDLIWAEMMATFLAVAILFFIFENCTRRRTFVTAFIVVVLTSLTISNLRAARLMVDRIDAGYNLYGWQAEPWFGTWWSSDAYKNAMRSGNDSTQDAVFASARRYRESKRIAEYVFKNIRPDLRGVGVVSEGLPVWRDNLATKITKFPAALRGALVFDIGWQQPESGIFFTKMDRHEEYLQKIVPSPGARPGSQAGPGKWLSILGRPDLRVYVFLEKSALEKAIAVSPSIVARDLSIALSDGQKSLDFWGAEIQSYSEVPVGEISSRYFFVVVPNVGGRSAWLALWP